MARFNGIPDAVLDAARAAAAPIDADVYLYNGTVDRSNDFSCVQHVFAECSRPRALLILITGGGDPDSAYKFMKYMQHKYDHITVLISSYCKSAGTLMTLGAHEVVFMPFGELGPLDIQLSKVDRFDGLYSGLTIKDALDTIEGRAVDMFQRISTEYVIMNKGLMSFATAAKAASDFVTQLYAPILGRFDPEEIGARSRSMQIATEYGKRLSNVPRNLKPDTLKLLAETYPSHSFVIDHQEAEQLFHNSRLVNDEERALVTALGRLARFQSSDLIFRALSISSSAEPGEGDHAESDRTGSPETDGGDPEGADGEADASAQPA